MAIPREYATSNPVQRDALSAVPATYAAGTPSGDFVAPDLPLDAEAVDYLVDAEHNLDLDDLRAADAEAKAVRFEVGTTGTLSVVERAKKTHIDTRKVEDANRYGIDIITQRGTMLRADILDAKEYRIAALVFAAANYGATHKDTTGLNFRTGDLQTLADGWSTTIADDGGIAPRYGLIGKTAWLNARKNATFREFAGGTDGNAKLTDLTLAAFAEFIGLEEVRVANYKRKIGNGTTATQFWDANTFLMFTRNDTVGTNTLAATPVVPYGEEFGAGGALVDVRTEPLPGTERRTEVGVYHRYRPVIRNGNLGFLVTGIVGV